MGGAMQDLADRLAIRELVESYNDAVMRFDADAWIANWTDDATWHLPGAGDVHGREAILGVWQAAMGQLEFVGFFAAAGPMVIDGDHATGRWYQQEFLHYPEGRRVDITGRYEDAYVRVDGRWRFRRRVYEIMSSREWTA